jgi:biotin carboxyl carrier protein
MGTAALAHEGESHDEPPPVATGNGPQRLPDGGVSLPKPAQRQMAVRTQLTVTAALPKALELQGKVVMDPNAGGKVQAALAGRLQPGPRGFPVLGQKVRKGEVLAYVVPAAGQLERANQSAALAELQASRSLAEKRLARLRELADSVPRKEIEAAESEVASLAARATAVGAGLSGRDALLAPVSGVIASAGAVAGQVVDARELVFEVVDPTRLRVEALAFDAATAQDIAGASLAVGGEAVPLVFLGAARSLREQALPVLFKASGDRLSRLAVGQLVTVVAQTRQTASGVRLPAAALVKNPANENIVWVKTAAERFAPRPVRTVPLDGAHVAVIAGLKAGERVVVSGASLINQIR